MKLIINRTDGGVSVMTLPDDATQEVIAAELAKWAAASNMVVTSSRVAGPGHIPQSRRWRDAWIDGGSGPLMVDLGKARSIKKQELLRLRDQTVADLTKQMDKADDLGDQQTVAKLKQQRKKLRTADTDLDAPLTAATTLTAIDAVTLPT